MRGAELPVLFARSAKRQEVFAGGVKLMDPVRAVAVGNEDGTIWSGVYARDFKLAGVFVLSALHRTWYLERHGAVEFEL